MVAAGKCAALPSTRYPHRNEPLLNGAGRFAYIEFGKIFCWNSTMSTLIARVPSTRAPSPRVVNDVTYFGTVAPSSGVCATSTDGCTAALTCAGSSPVHPIARTPAIPDHAIRAIVTPDNTVRSQLLIATSMECSSPLQTPIDSRMRSQGVFLNDIFKYTIKFE